MRNRRVSFAPDPELTMVHTFEKVRIHSSPQLNTAFEWHEHHTIPHFHTPNHKNNAG